MKKTFLKWISAFLIVILTNADIKAQLPNFDFEYWSGNPEAADNWFDYTSGGYITDISVVKVAGVSGFAAELRPVINVAGFGQYNSMITYSPNGSLAGGVPYTYLPDTLSFYYKYKTGYHPNNSTTTFSVDLTRYNTVSSTREYIAAAVVVFFDNDSTSTFKHMKIPFHYLGNVMSPDTLRAKVNMAFSFASDTIARFTIDQISLMGNLINTSIRTTGKNDNICVYPNVCDNALNFDFKGTEGFNFIKIIDISGKELMSEVINGSKYTLITKSLNSGCYTYILSTKKLVSKTGKFIVTH